MKTPQPPRGMTRLLWRLPIWLYRLKLGRLLGDRFVLINHVGRKSGRTRQALVEVVRHDKETDTYYVCSGFGRRSDWYRNLAAHPQVLIQVGNRQLAVTAHMLSPQECGEEMVRYVKTHPRLARSLMKVLGYDVPKAIEGYRQLAREHLPFVAFVPQHEPRGERLSA